MVKEIISYYWGGLGNQLFIYFTSKAISIKNDCEHKVDLTYYQNDIYNRSYELNKLGVNLDNCNRLTSFDFPLGNFFRKVSHKLGFHILRPQLKYISEFNKFDKTLNVENAYLYGYWQDFSTFDDLRNEIRDELDFSIIQNNLRVVNCLKLIEETPKSQRVFLGIRAFQETKSGASSEDDEFYKLGIDFFKNKIKNPKFFVFTNNQKSIFLLNKYKIDYYVIPSSKSENATIEDFFLGTQFENYILTNSTYYWWMNYLSRFDRTNVYASSKWSNKKSINPNWTIHI